MKYNVILITLIFLSCNKDPETVAYFEYSFDNGESFSTELHTMQYDSLQQATFIKYDDDNLKVRVNFRGRSSGMYEGEEGIFYKFSYNDEGDQNIEMVCDTYTGISVNISEYGAVGEWIIGDFSADACDGNSTAETVTGSFAIVRTE